MVLYDTNLTLGYKFCKSSMHGYSSEEGKLEIEHRKVPFLFLLHIGNTRFIYI